MAKKSKAPARGDYAEVYATVKMRYRTDFGRPCSELDMKEKFLDGDYTDVLDEEQLEIVSVDKIEIIS